MKALVHHKSNELHFYLAHILLRPSINHHALVPRLTKLFSVDPLRYPTFCVRVASHKSFVRATGQLTRS
jgi:hypothetical protein